MKMSLAKIGTVKLPRKSMIHSFLLKTKLLLWRSKVRHFGLFP